MRSRFAVSSSRGTIDQVFRQLEQLFGLIATTIDSWLSADGKNANALWTALKAALLEADYTLYIQRPPRDASVAVPRLRSFIDSC